MPISPVTGTQQSDEKMTILKGAHAVQIHKKDECRTLHNA
jgi:hypothetical protein